MARVIMERIIISFRSFVSRRRGRRGRSVDIYIYITVASPRFFVRLDAYLTFIFFVLVFFFLDRVSDIILLLIISNIPLYYIPHTTYQIPSPMFFSTFLVYWYYIYSTYSPTCFTCPDSHLPMLKYINFGGLLLKYLWPGATDYCIRLCPPGYCYHNILPHNTANTLISGLALHSVYTVSARLPEIFHFPYGRTPQNVRPQT